MKAEEIKRHYSLKLLKEDQWYIYIELTPRTQEAKADVRQIRLVLTKQNYLPRKLWFQANNGNEVEWDIPRIEENAPLARDEFTKSPVPPGWKLVHVGPEKEKLPPKKDPFPDPLSDH